MDADYLRDLADLAFRLLHVVAGSPGSARPSTSSSTSAWRRRLGRRRASSASTGASTAAASTTRRSTTGAAALPERLHWFKWEAYTTWLSGFALLVVLYWLDADTG